MNDTFRGERPCTGVICNETKCSETCGWHPAEHERRKRMVCGGAMKQDENGLYRLVIKRRKENVNAD